MQIEERPKVKRRRIVKVEDHATGSAAICADDTSSAKDFARVDSRRSRRLTPDELFRREKALLMKEQEVKCKSDDLEDRLLHISKKEERACYLVSQVKEIEAKTALMQLEEHFTCSL